MNFIKRIFKRKVFKGNGQREPRPLRIEGVKTAMTPQPDDAELAAQALLESRVYGDKEKRKVAHRDNGKAAHRDSGKADDPKKGTPEYYKQLSEKIRESHAAEARMTMRYLAYCEEQLALPTELYKGQTAEMEQELFKRQTIAEREGGELLRRWQHCLANVIVRQMSATDSTST